MLAWEVINQSLCSVFNTGYMSPLGEATAAALHFCIAREDVTWQP